MKKEFNSKLVYGDNNAGSWYTNFQSKNMPKEKAPCKCLSIIMLDFVVKAKKKYYPQTILEECKYEQEKIKMENLIDDNLEKSSSDEYDSESDDENDNEKFVESNE